MIEAIYDYVAQEENELTINEGEQLWILDSNDTDWWLVKAHNNGLCGLVPKIYLNINTDNPFNEDMIIKPQPQKSEDLKGSIANLEDLVEKQPLSKNEIILHKWHGLYHEGGKGGKKIKGRIVIYQDLEELYFLDKQKNILLIHPFSSIVTYDCKNKKLIIKESMEPIMMEMTKSEGRELQNFIQNLPKQKQNQKANESSIKDFNSHELSTNNKQEIPLKIKENANESRNENGNEQEEIEMKNLNIPPPLPKRKDSFIENFDKQVIRESSKESVNHEIQNDNNNNENENENSNNDENDEISTLMPLQTRSFPSPDPNLPIVMALYDYTAQNNNEIDIKEGYEMSLIEYIKDSDQCMVQLLDFPFEIGIIPTECIIKQEDEKNVYDDSNNLPIQSSNNKDKDEDKDDNEQNEDIDDNEQDKMSQEYHQESSRIPLKQGNNEMESSFPPKSVSPKPIYLDELIMRTAKRSMENLCITNDKEEEEMEGERRDRERMNESRDSFNENDGNVPVPPPLPSRKSPTSRLSPTPIVMMNMMRRKGMERGMRMKREEEEESHSSQSILKKKMEESRLSPTPLVQMASRMKNKEHASTSAATSITANAIGNKSTIFKDSKLDDLLAKRREMVDRITGGEERDDSQEKFLSTCNRQSSIKKGKTPFESNIEILDKSSCPPTQLKSISMGEKKGKEERQDLNKKSIKNQSKISCSKPFVPPKIIRKSPSPGPLVNNSGIAMATMTKNAIPPPPKPLSKSTCSKSYEIVKEERGNGGKIVNNSQDASFLAKARAKSPQMSKDSIAIDRSKSPIKSSPPSQVLPSSVKGMPKPPNPIANTTFNSSFTNNSHSSSFVNGGKMANSRIWIDKTGTFQIQAEYLSFDFNSEDVLLLKQNGTRIKVSISQLCQKDKEYVYQKAGIKRSSIDSTPSTTTNLSPSASISNAGNSFNWLRYFEDSVGIESNRASKYARRFMDENLGKDCLGQIDRFFLRARHVTYEEDIQKILKSVASEKSKISEKEMIEKNVSVARAGSPIGNSLKFNNHSYELNQADKIALDKMANRNIQDIKSLAPIPSLSTMPSSSFNHPSTMPFVQSERESRFNDNNINIRNGSNNLPLPSLPQYSQVAEPVMKPSTDYHQFPSSFRSGMNGTVLSSTSSYSNPLMTSNHQMRQSRSPSLPNTNIASVPSSYFPQSATLASHHNNSFAYPNSHNFIAPHSHSSTTRVSNFNSNSNNSSFPYAPPGSMTDMTYYQHLPDGTTVTTREIHRQQFQSVPSSSNLFSDTPSLQPLPSLSGSIYNLSNSQYHNPHSSSIPSISIIEGISGRKGGGRSNSDVGGNIGANVISQSSIFLSQNNNNTNGNVNGNNNRITEWREQDKYDIFKQIDPFAQGGDVIKK